MTKEDVEIKPLKERVKKERGGRHRGQKKEKLKPPTKIIIRHLPPTMTEEEFLKQIDPLPDHDSYYYVAADWSLGYDATCRAYITLKNYDDVFLFRDRFDGYVFVDSRGVEYPGIVEFAPFQDMLKNKSRRSDNKVNSIEEESHYQQFLQKLEEDREAAAKGSETKLEFSLDGKKEEKITSTPLLQYLANQKEKRRVENKKRTEEKRRQRVEEKEKRRQSQQQQQPIKIITNQESGSRRSDKNASNKENERSAVSQDERKSSRTKRRADRNVRRREEYENRKKERECLERNKKENNVTEASEEAVEKSGELKPGVNNNKKTEAAAVESEKKRNAEDKSADNKQRKEVKKYSEKRERERERNKQKEKSKEKNKDYSKDKSTEKDKEAESNSATAKGSEINESVLSFIRSVANAKEFVPRQKQNTPDLDEQKLPKWTEIAAGAKEFVPQKNQTEAASSTNSDKDIELNAVKEQLEKMSIEPKDEIKIDTEKESEVASIQDEDRQTQKQREDRRIRNKDRPSIAIYQPKARLRLSEERDTNTASAKEVRSNPTSDCESVKKEEPRSKKVSRYSERRLERRAKTDKRKTSESEREQDHDCERHELRKSKSCENDSPKSKPEITTDSKEEQGAKN